MTALKDFQKLFWICILTVTFGIVFSACGDDEEENNVVDSVSIVGTWRLTGYESWEKTNGNLDWESNDLDDAEISGIKFNTDKSGELTLYDGEKSSFKYVLNGNQLSLSVSDGGTDTYEISGLNATTLVIEYHELPTSQNPWETYEKMTFTRVN